MALICFVASVAVFLSGFITEYRQERAMRRGESVAVVPTLPMAVAAALILALGLLLLPVPWWFAPIAFVLCVMVFGKLIMLASTSGSNEGKQ
jgi:hypothetical protein